MFIIFHLLFILCVWDYDSTAALKEWSQFFPSFKSKHVHTFSNSNKYDILVIQEVLKQSVPFLQDSNLTFAHQCYTRKRLSCDTKWERFKESFREVTRRGDTLHPFFLSPILPILGLEHLLLSSSQKPFCLLTRISLDNPPFSELGMVNGR